jgi:DNA-binding MarR family transcriptional regulator
MSVATAAAAFAELFPATYLRFHRRDRKRSEPTQATRAVLQHLSMTGPLTVGEAARHLQRAQSVVSEIIDGLEARSLVERVRDPRDRRRTLVWLTDAGLALLAQEREVLSRALLERAMTRMREAERDALLTGLRALLRADDELRDPPSPAQSQRKPPRKMNET